MSTSREQLVLMLYEGAIQHCKDALDDMPHRHDKLIKAQNVVLELIYALDTKSGMESLASLYTYAYRWLVRGNLNETTEPIHEALVILKGLKSAWEIVMKGESNEVKNEEC